LDKGVRGEGVGFLTAKRYYIEIITSGVPEIPTPLTKRVVKRIYKMFTFSKIFLSLLDYECYRFTIFAVLHAI